MGRNATIALLGLLLVVGTDAAEARTRHGHAHRHHGHHRLHHGHASRRHGRHGRRFAHGRLPAAHDRAEGPGSAPVPRPPFEVARLGADGAIFDLVSRSAQSHGVPVALAHRLVRAESGYRCSARNPSGATGIMQVKPATARSVGVYGNLSDCATGLEAGMRYLAAAYRSAGSMSGAATLFNRGLGARPRSSAYSRKVMADL